ncbi:MAG TPA: flavodoxin domain-containing protein [Solirubrobacteraceae bacterium]|jgi:menaquinone-dependent protoporphyrinogen oxidase
MPRALIYFASTHGHTEKVARRIAAVMEGDGMTTDVRAAADGAEVRPLDYDMIVVGASIHAGHHQRGMVDWVRANHRSLNRIPSAFFSVSLTAADDTGESREATRRYIDDLLDDTGWTPRRTATVAGALQYREYDFATRLLVRLISAKLGRPTDASHDYDYTDWDAVVRFGHDCAAMVAGGSRPEPRLPAAA